MIDILYSLNKPGLVAIELDNHRVFLFASPNLLLYISKLIKDDGRFENGKVVVLETTYHVVESQLQLRHWQNEYRNKGWTIINERKRLVQFKIKKQLIDKHIYVYLVNRWYKPTLVGKFDSGVEADKFIDCFYKPGYTRITYDKSIRS